MGIMSAQHRVIREIGDERNMTKHHKLLFFVSTVLLGTFETVFASWPGSSINEQTSPEMGNRRKLSCRMSRPISSRFLA